MKVKTFIFWIIVIIVCVILYMQFFGEGGEQGMPISASGIVELRVVNTTFSQADFYIDGAQHRINPEDSKRIQASTGTHYIKCYYMDDQLQNTSEMNKINVQSSMTITISPKLGLIW